MRQHTALQKLVTGYLLEIFLAGVVDSSRFLSGHSYCKNVPLLTWYLCVMKKKLGFQKEALVAERSFEMKTIPLGFSLMSFPGRPNL